MIRTVLLGQACANAGKAATSVSIDPAAAIIASTVPARRAVHQHVMLSSSVTGAAGHAASPTGRLVSLADRFSRHHRLGGQR